MKRQSEQAAKLPPPGKRQEGPAVRCTRVRADEVWGLPKPAIEGDAGLDLTVSRYIMVHAGTRAQLPHNLSLAIPEGHFGLLLGRSSVLMKKGLIVHPGIVDSGFRGEVMTMVTNPGTKNVFVGEGERVSQLIILPVATFPVIDVRERDLPPGKRGTAGFGSTGGFSDIPAQINEPSGS